MEKHPKEMDQVDLFTKEFKRERTEIHVASQVLLPMHVSDESGWMTIIATIQVKRRRRYKPSSLVFGRNK